LKNKQKIGLSVASSFEVTKGFEVGWRREQRALRARCSLLPFIRLQQCRFDQNTKRRV